MEIRKHLKMLIYYLLNSWYVAKTMLKDKFLFWIHIRREERLKSMSKEEINGRFLENEINYQNQKRYFGKSNTIDKPFMRLIKGKQERMQKYLTLEMKGDISTDAYVFNFMPNTFETWGEINKVLRNITLKLI